MPIGHWKGAHQLKDPGVLSRRIPYSSNLTGTHALALIPLLVFPHSVRAGSSPQEEDRWRDGVEVVLSRGDSEQEIDKPSTRVNSAKMIQDASRRHLERERAGAARKIQAAYHCYSKRKSVVLKRTNLTQASYRYRLRKKSMEMGWSEDSQYSILFRYPLGYILVCLDLIKWLVESEEKDVKKWTTIEGNQEALSYLRCDTIG